LARVEVARISRASAAQRAGRAGRTGPGRVIRLYPEMDLLRRPEHDVAEVLRRELAEPCLHLHAAGVTDPRTLDWVDAPPEATLAAAEELLRRLGALDGAGAITASGRRMAELPLHPRLATLALGAGEAGCAAAAALSAGARLPAEAPHEALSDLLVLVEQGLDGQARQTEKQILRLVRPRRGPVDERALCRAALRAFPDRVGRRLKGQELRLAGGTAAVLAKNSAVRAELIVALEAVEPEWLLDLYPERVTERRRVEWHRTGERVEAWSALEYDGVAIEESRSEPTDEEAGAMVAAKALEAGLHRLADVGKVEDLLGRVKFASAHGGPAAPEVAEVVRRLASGCRSLAELAARTRDGGLERALLEELGSGRAALERLAPEKIRLPSGRMARVEYHLDGRTPSVASRLQDFFGLRETPRVAGGAVPLVVELLAPSRRPVQVTQDLAGFWERLYPQVRRELMRRYPKHAWPENPYNTWKD
jgi:ATP-dependent helicase HrpB